MGGNLFFVRKSVLPTEFDCAILLMKGKPLISLSALSDIPRTESKNYRTKQIITDRPVAFRKLGNIFVIFRNFINIFNAFLQNLVVE